MTSAEIRRRFLSFFEAKGHVVRPSDGLIPSGDPTVLFTSAGMNQFKDYFLGKRTDLTRAASAQKCLRTGDLERVGLSASHHSFFEMLGNFSFGDYFKPEAIAWGWEFLTGTTDFAGTHKSQDAARCLNLPGAKLWVSVYEDDDEAVKLWKKLGVPEARIKRFGQTDNFWPANAPKDGPNGPCGPCSEIYFDPDGGVHTPTSLEVWNLVFTQFDRQSDGSLKQLPKGNIDTGMGLERLTRVVQQTETDYEIDLFLPIVAAVRALPKGPKAKPGDATVAERAIADHARAIVLLLAEGLLPSNEGRGYVLRMLIRRAFRFARVTFDLPPTATATYVSGLTASVQQAYTGSPHEALLTEKRAHIERAWGQELQQFGATLEAGTARLDEIMARLTPGQAVSGEEAFKLYDTFGVPLELTVDITGERRLSVDRAGFDKAMAAQQKRSRAGSQFTGGGFVGEDLLVRAAIKPLPPKDALFVGYGHAPEDLSVHTMVRGLWDGATWATEAREGQTVGIVLEQSPFYGESGGQIGDVGTITGAKGSAEVVQTTWADDVLVHHAKVCEGRLKVQEPVTASVDAERRMKISRSHTATHLLHWALRKVLGPDAVQGGSYNEAERLRFDFSSLKGLQEQQRQDAEALVNERIRHADGVHAAYMGIDEARKTGALALFGEKYGSTVRVVTIGDYSRELCGGTHLRHTGFLGEFTIIGESSIAAGTRRVEALVGGAAVERLRQQQRLLHEAARRLGRPAEELVVGLEELIEKVKQLDKERKALQGELAKVEARRLVAEGKRIDGVTVVMSSMRHADREALAVLADAVKTALREQGVVLLASGDGGQVSVVVAVTPDVATRVHAGQLLKAIAPLVAGSGGGRPEFAQGGGKDPAGIPAALRKAEELVREALATTTA